MGWLERLGRQRSSAGHMTTVKDWSHEDATYTDTVVESSSSELSQHKSASWLGELVLRLSGKNEYDFHTPKERSV